MNRDYRGRAAFSLLELTIVILILGIIAAAAQPHYSAALAVFRVDSAAGRVAADLQFAATRARVTSKPVKVAFNPDTLTNVYRFEAIADPFHAAVAMDPTDAATWYTVDFNQEPYGVALTASADLTFDLYGVPDQSGQITVSSGSQSRRVVVDAATGEVTIE